MAAEARAKLKLQNGREVWRDCRGRYRDTETGKWVSRTEVEAALISIQKPDPNKPQNRPARKSKPAHGLKAQTEKQIMAAVQHMGHTAGSLEEAIGHLLAVQAEIALDKDNGTKSTSAARLIGLFTGTLQNSARQDEETAEEDQPWFVLGRARAKELLALIEAEQSQRKAEKDPGNSES